MNFKTLTAFLFVCRCAMDEAEKRDATPHDLVVLSDMLFDGISNGALENGAAWNVESFRTFAMESIICVCGDKKTFV
jgi:hypothetical protein